LVWADAFNPAKIINKAQIFGIDLFNVFIVLLMCSLLPLVV